MSCKYSLSFGGFNRAVNYKGKGKVRPRRGREVSDGELRYSLTLSLASALGEVGG